ncbi:ABC transporter substrate-binding protein [Lysinibacillus sp. LZ02]|uniref:ABC transporter substrate-binding protein n=1 Tax=Lysinibacillus sp. LZ02 TaxID=3420668 RepID=UPI003D362467
MKVLKRGLFICLLVILGVVLVACSSDSNTAEENTESDTATETGTMENASTKEAQELVIGFTGPLSGPAALYGTETLNGLTLAVDEINENGGIEINGQPYTVKIASLDDKYLPNEAATNAKRLVQEEKAKVVYTPHSGGVYALQVFNEQEDFIVMAYTSEPGIIEQGNALTVRIPPGYDTYLEPFTKYEMDRFGKKIAFLPTASQYGKDWAEALRPVWEANGGEIVFDESIDFTKDTDFQTIMTNALSKNPDVLFIGGASEPTALVLKQARDLGFEGGFIIMDQAKFDQMAAVLGGSYELLEGSVSTLPLVHASYPGTETFIDNYRTDYKKDPGAEAGFHYISLNILLDAMKIAGTVDDTKAIRVAMDEAAKNQPEEKQVYTIGGVNEKGGFHSILRMSYIENGEVVEFTKEDLK